MKAFLSAISPIRCVLIFTLNLFLYCYNGKLASESYKQIADALYDCNWLGLPLNYQKYFILKIANAQIPLNYHGYGIFELNLESFIDVSVHSNMIEKVYRNLYFDWRNHFVNVSSWCEPCTLTTWCSKP